MLKNDTRITKFGVDTAEKCTIENGIFNREEERRDRHRQLQREEGQERRAASARPVPRRGGPPAQFFSTMACSKFGSFNRAFLGCIDAKFSDPGVIF